MRSHGVQYIHIVGVDNVLNKLADPLFVGFAMKGNYTIASKYVQKRNAEEKVGVHLLVNGKPAMLEYTEIGNLAEELNEKGELKYNAAYISTFIVKTEFIHSITNDPDMIKSLNSKYHLAEKKIKY